MKYINISSMLGVATPIALAMSFLWTPVVNSDDDDHYRWGSSVKTDAVYEEECGACHLAFGADWLPQRSWNKVMSGLEDHFGDNAELDSDEFNHISTYLKLNAAGVADTYRSNKMSRAVSGGKVPIRITDTRYFQRKHHELSDRLVANNPKVGSFSRCEVCHEDAANGDFDEDGVSIPGYGRWED